MTIGFDGVQGSAVLKIAFQSMGVLIAFAKDVYF